MYPIRGRAVDIDIPELDPSPDPRLHTPTVHTDMARRTLQDIFHSVSGLMQILSFEERRSKLNLPRSTLKELLVYAKSHKKSRTCVLKPY